MRSGLRTSVIAAIALALSAPLTATQTKKPNIVILATGGTIDGAAATGTQAGYTSGAVGIDTMVAGVPGIRDLAEIKGEQISNVGSQDMSLAIWLKLASRINALTQGNAVDGIVITHGTDTMSETAKLLAEKVSGKTIVLTGAMIPIKFGSSDGLFNLGSALAFAQTLKPGVYIVMNGRYFNWNNVRKNKQTGMFEELKNPVA